MMFSHLSIYKFFRNPLDVGFLKKVVWNCSIGGRTGRGESRHGDQQWDKGVRSRYPGYRRGAPRGPRDPGA